ncbi:NAD(P)-dependent alcohol dehydrogenase [Myxococcus sp. K15C18031901]|uniref:NAD(P)-dependent alcohol dehydrogenase n=1 Tax=Myxococcus dinghuensis TaxID=2906761 RepID=UPI0020A81D44|nr:NAD(P)-dependent alcohol dehydrogenase [Myxococcus dinghuensis]MCP3098423.1 NAD(P)-dependent alcohol dehydrogenase [Myxococcus dinghuensis]
MYDAKAYSASAAKAPLAPTTIQRRDVGERDVRLDVLYCGICHSDLHQVKDDFGGAGFPMVPGHEIVGKVTRVGAKVTKFKEGDIAAVGCLVDSDRTCSECKSGFEQFCANRVLVFNSPDELLGGQTYGGFSESMVVDEDFVLRVPSKLDLAAAAPLLCAGVTVYSPLRYWKIGKGSKVGVVGLGGLGHLAVKFAHALGAHVAVLTTSARKKDDALRLGAEEVIVSTDTEAMKKQAGSFDFILDTVSGEHDVNALLQLARRDGSVVVVGLPPKPMPIGAFPLVAGRKHLSGSNIGGIAETQEMLDFAAEHGITADVEVLPIQKVNEAFDRLERGDVKYRFVLDMRPLKST